MQKQREHWSSHLGFLLAAAGSAIGLGTLWKFPYVTGQFGGGLFVLIYMLSIFFIGIPVFVAELILGRRAQRGAVGIFETLGPPAWKIAGWMGVAASFLIMSYYSVIAGWGLNYVLMSMNQFYENKDAAQITSIFNTLASSPDITLFWHFAFTALTVAVVYPGVRQGVEYWSRRMTIALLFLLVGLCAYSITLEGFGDAMRFVFYPDFSKFNVNGALEALGLSFFTLSLGQGIMLTYGSYLKRTEDIPATSGIIGVMITFVSVLAAVMIFPIIFTFGATPEGGPGLVFKTLPLLFSKLPGALIISTSFFLLFVFTALTSSVALVEVVAANFMDLLGWSRKKAVLTVGLASFIFGIPSALSDTNTLFANWAAIYGKNFFITIDSLVSTWLLPIGGLLISIYVGWIFDPKESREEFELGTKYSWLFAPWFFFIRWVCPIAILLILLQKSGIIDIQTLL